MKERKRNPRPHVVDEITDPASYAIATSGVVNALQDPNNLLNTFLKENGLLLTVTAISDDNSYIEGQGFVLTDKPLLVITAKYKHA